MPIQSSFLSLSFNKRKESGGANPLNFLVVAPRGSYILCSYNSVGKFSVLNVKYQACHHVSCTWERRDTDMKAMWQQEVFHLLHIPALRNNPRCCRQTLSCGYGAITHKSSSVDTMTNRAETTHPPPIGNRIRFQDTLVLSFDPRLRGFGT